MARQSASKIFFMALLQGVGKSNDAQHIVFARRCVANVLEACAWRSPTRPRKTAWATGGRCYVLVHRFTCRGTVEVWQKRGKQLDGKGGTHGNSGLALHQQ